MELPSGMPLKMRSPVTAWRGPSKSFRKAAAWWRQHGGAAPEPTSVGEAISRHGELAPTIGITVDFAGEWPQVLSVRSQGEPGEWEPDDAERAPLADADLLDIPF